MGIYGFLRRRRPADPSPALPRPWLTRRGFTAVAVAFVLFTYRHHFRFLCAGVAADGEVTQGRSVRSSRTTEYEFTDDDGVRRTEAPFQTGDTAAFWYPPDGSGRNRLITGWFQRSLMALLPLWLAVAAGGVRVAVAAAPAEPWLRFARVLNRRRCLRWPEAGGYAFVEIVSIDHTVGDDPRGRFRDISSEPFCVAGVTFHSRPFGRQGAYRGRRTGVGSLGDGVVVRVACLNDRILRIGLLPAKPVRA